MGTHAFQVFNVNLQNILTQMISKILQIIWAFTAGLAFYISIKNYYEYKIFNHHVLVPFFLGLFCVYLFFNIWKQIKKSKERKNKNQ